MRKEYADRDKEGNPIVNQVDVGGFMDNAYKITKQLNEFNKESEKLDKKYKEAISYRQQQVKDYAKFIEKKIDFTLKKVDKKLIPKKGLTPDVVSAFLLLV